MKKVSCMVLAVFLLLCTFPFAVAVSAEEIELPPVDSLPYRYELINGEVIVTGFNGQQTDTELVIPAKLGAYPVTEIRAGAFRGVSNLVTVQLSDGLKVIGDNAFSDCELLATIVIPATVTKIGTEAFSGCALLNTIRIPKSTVNVGSNVFKGCTKLTTVNCAANARPSGWNADWLGCGATVAWGASRPHEHPLIHEFGTDPTCQAAGVAEHYHCDTCNKNFSDRSGTVDMPIISIPKLAHIKGDWETVKEATKQEAGESVRKCTACGEVLERKTLPKLEDGVRGDVNGDGKVNSVDYIKARRAYFRLVSLTEQQLARVDFNGNGKLDAAECVKLKRAIFGLIKL